MLDPVVHLHGATLLQPHRTRWSTPVLAATLAGLVALGAPRVGSLLAATLGLALGALAVALPLGVALALLIEKVELRGRGAARLVLVAMLFTPLYLHAAGWEAGFGVLGWATAALAAGHRAAPWLDGWQGAAWVHGVAATPWVALLVGGALAAAPRGVEEQALLAAPPWSVLTRISLRSAWLAAPLAATAVALGVAGEVCVTDLFQVRAFAEEVYTQASLGLFESLSDGPLDAGLPPAGAPFEAALGWWGLAGGAACLALVAAVVVELGSRIEPLATSETGERVWRWRPRATRPLAYALLVGILALVAGVPLGSLVYKAGVVVERGPEGWVQSWSAGRLASLLTLAPWEHRRELATSAALGATVATSALVIGGAAAWLLRRRDALQGPWAWALGLMLAAPGPLIGVLVVRLLNQPPDSPGAFLAWWYDHTLLAPWMAQMCRAAPVATLVLWPVWRAAPRGVLDAAALDGAGPLRAWLLVARAQAPGVAAAWVACLAVSVGEVGATQLVLPPGETTVASRVFSLLHYGVDDRLAALALTLTAASAGLAWLATRLWRAGVDRTPQPPADGDAVAAPPLR